MMCFIVAFLGAVGVGVTVTTMNPTYRPEEIARQLENSGARYTEDQISSAWWGYYDPQLRALQGYN
jgi:acyl-CoA synthetase (AMP-forming)/AMP-acid ligase II